MSLEPEDPIQVFSMSQWYQETTGKEDVCHTVACIAGWQCHLSGHDTSEWNNGNPGSWNDWDNPEDPTYIGTARKELGLNCEQAEALFMPENPGEEDLCWWDSRDITVAVAVECLRSMAQTGQVDYAGILCDPEKCDHYCQNCSANTLADQGLRFLRAQSTRFVPTTYQDPETGLCDRCYEDLACRECGAHRETCGCCHECGGNENISDPNYGGCLCWEEDTEE